MTEVFYVTAKTGERVEISEHYFDPEKVLVTYRGRTYERPRSVIGTTIIRKTREYNPPGEKKPPQGTVKIGFAGPECIVTVINMSNGQTERYLIRVPNVEYRQVPVRENSSEKTTRIFEVVDESDATPGISIISSKSDMALKMMGQMAGCSFSLSDREGNTTEYQITDIERRFGMNLFD